MLHLLPIVAVDVVPDFRVYGRDSVVVGWPRFDIGFDDGEPSAPAGCRPAMRRESTKTSPMIRAAITKSVAGWRPIRVVPTAMTINRPIAVASKTTGEGEGTMVNW